MASRSTAQLDPALLPNRLERGIYVSIDEMDAVSPPLPYAHTIRRLFEDLELDGVLYVGRMPRAVFKRVERLQAAEVRQWHRIVWNHAVTPLLVLLCGTKVRVYSAQALPAGDDEDVDSGGRLVPTLESIAGVLEFDNLVSSIEAGEVFRDRQAHFDREKAVDRYLLRNIDAAANLIQSSSDPSRPLTVEQSHRLLLRLLFSCYLIDREMILGRHFPENDPLSALSKDFGLGRILDGLQPRLRLGALFHLFRQIGRLFNGSVFDADDLASDQATLGDSNDGPVDVVMRFLRGDDLGNRQLALGFWAYDFRHIPVETVSAIYEGFLRTGDDDTQAETGAYYTPPHLAELVVDVALEGIEKPLLHCTVLDPACGSGVFLVAVFNRMAEFWRRKHPRCRNLTRARELQGFLKEQLVGIDKNGTACRIACFSLYLAYLDQLDPRDVEELRVRGVRLPDLLLRKGQQQPRSKRRTVLERNFFAKDRQLPRKDFDLVVGNPPWVSRGEVTDAEFLRWLGNCRRPIPQNQMACGFLWEIPPLLAPSGQACLLLPSAVVLNRTDDFQAQWFSTVTVKKVVDLSDLSFLLFPGADRPAIVMRFRAECPTPETQVTYASPKTSLESQLGGPVLVLDEDLTTVSVSEILEQAGLRQAPMIWKTRLWGTPRDRRFVQRLCDMPQLNELAGTPKQGRRWIKGQGLQPYSENDRKKGVTLRHGWWTHRHLFLDADSPDIHFVVTNRDCAPVSAEFDSLRRLPDRRLFDRPKVLISQGSRTMKIAFCDFPVLFRDSLQSISGPPSDVDLLPLMAASVHSRLAEFFFFHTSASLGTERDKTHFYELLRFPFPLPEQTTDPAVSRAIIAELSQEVDGLAKRIRSGALDVGRQEAVHELQRRLWPLICKYYDLDECEAMLIDDTLDIFKPSATPASPGVLVPALRRPDEAERMRYLNTLCASLQSRSVPGFNGHIAGITMTGPGLSVALVSLTKNRNAVQNREIAAINGISRPLCQIAASLPSPRGSLVFMRNLKIVQHGQIHLIKPMALRSWSRTAALNDADEIISAIVLRGSKF